MDFKKATEELMAGMTREQIADALQASPRSTRSARPGFEELPNAHRNPPGGWGSRGGEAGKATGGTPHTPSGTAGSGLGRHFSLFSRRDYLLTWVCHV